MSSMTVGENRKFRPRIRLLRLARPSPSNLCGAEPISSSRDINVSSEHQLLLGRLAVVADIDDPVIHGIAEILAGVAEDHHASTLHHEAAKCAGPPAGNDGAALHVDADAAAGVPHADEVSSAQAGAERRAGIL